MNISYGQCHYRCSFDVKPLNYNQETWSTLVKMVRDWIARKPLNTTDLYGSWFYIGDNWSSGCEKKVRIITERLVGNGTERSPEHWSVRFIHSCDEYPSQRWWQTDIGISQNKNGFRFNLNLMHYLKSDYIGKEPPHPMPSSPGIVKKLLLSRDWECSIGDEILTLHPKPLNEGSGESFRELLQSESRYNPIVLISRNYHTNTLEFPTEILAKHLAGVASVYESTSNRLDKELEWCLGWRMSCWNGMVRIYQPKVIFIKTDDARRHRYFKRDQIKTLGQDVVIDMIVRGICRRNTHLLKHGAFSIDDVRAIKREHQIRKLKESLKGDSELQEFYEVLSKENDNYKIVKDALECEVEIHKEEIGGLEKKKADLEYQLKNTRRRNEELGAKTKHLENKLSTFENMKEFPQNNIDVMRLISTIYEDRIYITPRGWKSAEEYEFKELHILWKCLWEISTKLYALVFERDNVKINIEQEFKSQTGYELTLKEGPMTNKDAQLKKLREDTYKEKTIDITPHIKWGNRTPKLLRIHFYLCHETKKIVIGHCGDHLDNRITKSTR